MTKTTQPREQAIPTLGYLYEYGNGPGMRVLSGYEPLVFFRANPAAKDGQVTELVARTTRQAAPEAPTLTQRLNAPDQIDAYARQLAMSLWRTHYRLIAPEFELLDDTYGVLSQIDNMLTGLVLAATGAAPEAPASEQQATCWSCTKPYTLEQRANADGNCPHCGVEIELATPAATTASASPVKHCDVLAICDAYESGIGHGLQHDGHDSGSIFGNPVHGVAYEIGYDEGKRRAPAPSRNAAPLDEQAIFGVLHDCMGGDIARARLRDAAQKVAALTQQSAAQAPSKLASYPLEDMGFDKAPDSKGIFRANDWQLTVGDVRKARAAQAAHAGAAEMPRYTCKGKGGEYELIGVAYGAGTSRGVTVNLYRETATGVNYYRTPADFADRMERIDRAAMSAATEQGEKP